MWDQPFFTPAILILTLSIPLIFGIVPPNRFYGVRTAQTLRNTQLWYSANRLAGCLANIASIVYIVIAQIYPYTKTAPDDFQLWLIHLGAFFFPLLMLILIVSSYLKKRA